MKFAIFVFSCVNVFLQAFSIQLLWNTWLLPTFPITFAQAILVPVVYSLATFKMADMVKNNAAMKGYTDEDVLTFSVAFALAYGVAIGVFYAVKAFM